MTLEESRKEFENTQLDGKHWDLTPKDKILNWKYFCRDIESKDLQFDEELEQVLLNHMDEEIDFRPYMVDNPFKVSTTDYLTKIVDIFRKMSMRHLIVVDQNTGQLAGIITRKNIFKWMEL